MRVLIDVDSSGAEHIIETDPDKYVKVYDPADPTQLVDILTMLSHIKDRLDLQELGGWHVVNQLPGEDFPKTRWVRLLDAVLLSDDVKVREALGL